MSSPGKRGDSGIQETNLDDVEVDDEGNIRFPDDSSVDSREEDDSVMEVDEDGNLRIQSATKLLDEVKDQGEQSSPDDGLSAEERQSLQRRQSERRHYSDEGTAEEGAGMLALDSFMEEDQNGTRPDVQGHDLHDIELTVFERPQPERAVDSAANVHSLERGDAEEHVAAERKPKRKGLQRFPGIVGRSLSSSSPSRLLVITAVAIVVIGVLLTVSLLPASFVYVEYYELALSKSRVTGKVNREDVYYPGCHLLTPDAELVRFKGTAHIVNQNVGIFTSDRLSFSLGISLQYFIKPEELGQLFTNYERKYEPVVEAMIRSTVQNTAIIFNLDSFRLNRSHVEQTLRQAVALKLSGNCCPSCCPFECGGSVNCRTCRLIGRGCAKGIHMEMKYFQMGAVDIPEEVSERFLRQTVLLIEAEKELFLQKHAVETKISEQLQKDILNKASEIREAASAEAEKIRLIAEADYEKTVQMSFAGAMKKFYQQLNITQEDHKLSFMYIRALEDISDNLYNLNYDHLTTSN